MARCKTTQKHCQRRQTKQVVARVAGNVHGFSSTGFKPFTGFGYELNGCVHFVVKAEAKTGFKPFTGAGYKLGRE